MRSVPLPAALAGLLLAGCGSGRPQPPTVVLVTIESLRTDHVGAYGGRSRTRPEVPLTPHLDAIAAQSMVYDDAHAVTSWTLTSHASLFTGLYPTGHRVLHSRDMLDDSYTTLAERLAERGYQTAGVVSGPYLRRPFNLSQGFERWDDGAATALPEASHGDVTNPAMAAALDRILDEARDPSRPLFLFAYFWDPHYDYIPPPPWDRAFVSDACEPFDVRGYGRRDDLGPDLAPGRLAYLWSQYEGEIRATDEVLGHLVDALRARGLWDDALVVVTADHGEEFFEHGDRGHKNNLFVESVHVPLVVKYPRGGPHGHDGRLASLVDVLPTVLDAIGAPVPRGIDGRSLRAAPPADRAILFELIRGASRAGADGTTGQGLALWGGIRTATQKLVWSEFAPPGAATNDDTDLDYVGLFDVAADPGEQHNLGEAHLDEVQALAKRFLAESAGARAEAERHPPPPQATLDAPAVDRLRALGYVEGP